MNSKTDIESGADSGSDVTSLSGRGTNSFVADKIATNENSELTLKVTDTEKAVLRAPNSHGLEPGQKFLDKGRQKWPQEIDSILALVAFAVDIANISRFPFVCYKHGKSAFLIPYFTFMIVSAFPILYMELILGQFVQQGCLSVWKIAPLFKGIGYCIEMIQVFVIMYYNTVLVWSFVFISESFNETLPWTSCENSWNTRNSCIVPTEEAFNAADKDSLANKSTAGQEYFRRRVLRIWTSPYADGKEAVYDESFGFVSKGNHGMGTPNLDLSGWMLLVFVLLFIVLIFGINLSRRIIWFTATVPYIILAILFFRGITLPGAMDGILELVNPDFEKLFETETWVNGAIQIFYSSGAGFCIHMTHASHNKFHQNIFRDAIVTLAANCFTSIFAALVIFAYLGNLAKILRKNASDVVTIGIMCIGPDLLFEVYPDCIGKLSGSRFFAVIFFLMIVFIGFDTAIGGIQAITLGFLDEFKKWFPAHKNSEQIFNFTVISFCYVINLLCCTRGGMWMYMFMDTYAAGVSLVFAILCLTLVVSWVWGMEDLCKAAEAMTGRKPGLYLRFCWKFLSPASLITVLIFSISGLKETVITYEGEVAPPSTYLAGIILSFLPLAVIPVYAIYEIMHYPADNFKEKMQLLLCPENEHAQIKANKSTGKRLTMAHLFYFGGITVDCSSHEVPKTIRPSAVSLALDVLIEEDLPAATTTTVEEKASKVSKERKHKRLRGNKVQEDSPKVGRISHNNDSNQEEQSVVTTIQNEIHNRKNSEPRLSLQIEPSKSILLESPSQFLVDSVPRISIEPPPKISIDKSKQVKKGDTIEPSIVKVKPKHSKVDRKKK